MGQASQRWPSLPPCSWVLVWVLYFTCSMEAGPEPKIQAVPRDAPEEQRGLKLAQGLLLQTEVQIKFQLWKRISLPLDKDTLVLSNSNALRAYLRSKIIFTFTRYGMHILSAIKLQGAKTAQDFFSTPTLWNTQIFIYTLPASLTVHCRLWPL